MKIISGQRLRIRMHIDKCFRYGLGQNNTQLNPLPCVATPSAAEEHFWNDSEIDFFKFSFK